MNLIELKAAAYDTLANIEMLNEQLRRINQEIAAELEKVKKEKEG